MKHWDLIPNKVVTLRRGLDSSAIAWPEGAEDVRARFLFRTTAVACFQTIIEPYSWIELELRDDGSLEHVEAHFDSPRSSNRIVTARQNWHVVGAPRETREALGKGATR